MVVVIGSTGCGDLVLGITRGLMRLCRGHRGCEIQAEGSVGGSCESGGEEVGWWCRAESDCSSPFMHVHDHEENKDGKSC